MYMLSLLIVPPVGLPLVTNGKPSLFFHDICRNIIYIIIFENDKGRTS